VTGAQQALDAAMQEAERLRKTLQKRGAGGAQVRSDDEKRIVRASAHAWFNSHRPPVSAVLTDDDLRPLDDGYRTLMVAAGRATLRTRYLDSLKQVKKLLSQLQADHAIALGRTGSGQGPAATTNSPPEFAPLISDAKMQAILGKRWQECVTCVNYGAPLAATVMMGGILEGLLLARINQLSDQGPVFKALSAPKDRKTGSPLKLSEWGLKNYIDVAHELGWISRTTKDVGEVVRDYRNYIHPQKELSHGITLSVDDARMLWEIAKSIVRQLLSP